MKFLLTSSGLTNQAIADALIDLVGKRPEETTVAFVPTAANVEASNKTWLIRDLWNIKQQNFKSIDIVDISALPKENWLPRLEAADVLFFSGGNTFYSIHWIKKSRLAELLPDLLQTRVYVGISAGSISATKGLTFSQSKRLYDEDPSDERDEEGLGFLDFHFRPHLNSPKFPKVREEFIRETAKEKNIKTPVYALDDNCALKIDGDTIEVVGGGEYMKI